jgi:predicted acylesterase/phospholipase RssA
MPAVQTGLILQGGGALGAYEFGVLRRLFEEPGGFAPDVISGVSIGAINTSALCSISASHASASASKPDIATQMWR